jgi:coenzyme PQQ synthesis protein D (PqqD)
MVVLSEKAKVVVAKEQVSSNLGGEAAILNLKNGVYYGLDSVGARVWALIQQPRTIAELRDILAAEYDVATPRLEADLFELLSNLASKELVEVA